MADLQLPAEKPWLRLPDETTIAYDRFITYLELGPERSIAAVRKKLSKKSGYERQLLNWSAKYRWVDRAASWDDHLILKSLEAKEKGVNVSRGMMIKELRKVTQELIDIALMPLYYDSEQTGTNVGHKIRAIEAILDRAGVTKLTDQDAPAPQTVNNYIQNIYKKIEQRAESEGL